MSPAPKKPKARPAVADKVATPGAPAPEAPTSATPTQMALTPAAWAYQRLVSYIRNFEAQLNPAEEVAMGFAGGEAGILRIEGLGYYDPDILTYYGRDDDGARTQLVQHVTQLSVILRAVPVRSPDEPARRIGFRLPDGWHGGDAGDASA